MRFSEKALWLAILSFGSLTLQTLLWAFLFEHWFDFALLRPAAWHGLAAFFRAGGAVRFDFVLTLLSMILLAFLSEIILLLSLPGLQGWLPPLPSRRSIRQAPPPPRPSCPPRPPVAPPQPDPPAIPMVEIAAPPAAPPSAAHSPASVLARMMALAEVCEDPPAGWIIDALREEAARLAPSDWALLEPLGAAALTLLALLDKEGLMPRSTEIEALWSALQRDGATGEVALPAKLTSGAAWLSELADHFVPGRDSAIEKLLLRAMRAMTADDWRSLDTHPEKARRARLATDHLSSLIEDMPAKSKGAAGQRAAITS